MRDHLLVYVNGRPIRVAGDDAFLTLSDFLRRRQGLTGTKVVCAEGDCGSCAALIGRIGADGQLAYAAVTSCIQMMFQLDGAHVVTIEGLNDGGQLNPIQRAMVDCHGAQCGFCTPGFVVSLYDLLHDGLRPCDAQTVTRALVGNLCRCTGYTSIVRAACETDRTALKPIDALYPPGPIVAELSKAQREPVLIHADERHFHKPVTVEEAVRFKQGHPGCAVVAGATDVGVQHNKRTRVFSDVLSTAALESLRTITVSADAVHVGATATLSELERATSSALPEFSNFLARFGSPLIKNSATLAGNLVNASPIGDTIPALMVLGAEVELSGVAGSRRVDLNAFYTGYRKTVLAEDELVTAIHIPLPRPGEVYRLFKVSKRKDLDISTFGAAVWIRLNIDPARPTAAKPMDSSMGSTPPIIEDVKIAYGGVAATVLRMIRAESLLRGRRATLEVFEAAGDATADAITPLSDVRGSQEYRRLLARNILPKLWYETFDDGTHDDDGRNGDDRDGDGNGHPTTPHAGAQRPGSARSAAPDAFSLDDL